MAAGNHDDEPLTPAASRRRHRQPPRVLAVVAATLVVGMLVRGGPTPATATRCVIPIGTGEDDNWRPPSTVEVVLQAQTVIYGRVRRTFPDESLGLRPNLVYTALMDVYCTLKGRRLDPVVNVSKAGPSLLNIPTVHKTRATQWCYQPCAGVKFSGSWDPHHTGRLPHALYGLTSMFRSC